jgi:hypothetical protein
MARRFAEGVRCAHLIAAATVFWLGLVSVLAIQSATTLLGAAYSSTCRRRRPSAVIKSRFARNPAFPPRQEVRESIARDLRGVRVRAIGVRGRLRAG